MIPIKFILSGASAVFFATVVQAQDPAMVVVSGKCQKLVVGKSDLSAHCKSKLMNTSYPDGRVGFYFTISDGSIVTVSGIDLPNQTPDTDQIRVDKLIMKIGHADVPPAESAATGKCTFGNPYKGKSSIKCSGKLITGERFDFAFRTDGKRPKQ